MKTRCPGCGASFALPPRSDGEVTCAHCGAPIPVRPDAHQRQGHALVDGLAAARRQAARARRKRLVWLLAVVAFATVGAVIGMTT